MLVTRTSLRRQLHAGRHQIAFDMLRHHLAFKMTDPLDVVSLDLLETAHGGTVSHL